jgi:hypothetical protein
MAGAVYAARTNESSVAAVNMSGAFGDRVKVRGYLRRRESMVDLFDTIAARDAADGRQCVSLVLSRDQLEAVKRSSNGARWTVVGTITADPLAAAGEPVYNVRIGGRRWYYTNCTSGKVVIVRTMTAK